MTLGPGKASKRRYLTRRTSPSRDATAWRESQKKLEEAETVLANAEKAAQIGIWTADPQKGELVISPHLMKMLGIVVSNPPAVSALLWGLVQSCGSVSPDDSPQPLDREVLYAHPDGKEHIFQARTIAAARDSQSSLQFVGTLRDITEEKVAEQKLQESQALLAQAEQIANLGSWDFEVTTRKVTWSEQLYHLLGYCPWEPAAEELYSQNLHPWDRVRVRGIVDNAIEQCREFNCVVRYRLPSGKYRVQAIRGVPIRGEHGKAARLIGIVQDVTEQSQVEADLHRLSRDLIRARDEERRHMARELHESAGQSLAALKMTLGNLRDALPKRNSLASSLVKTCFDLTNEAVKEVRTISYLMHPPMLDEAGLPSAVQWYARGFAERSQIQVDVQVAGDFGRQPQEIEMTVFRVIQEALTNVHRYSGSKTACIRLERNATHICAEVQDQGCGLVMPAQGHRNGNSQPNGVGIAGMRERVHQLNGTFEMDSIPGRGTTVRVILPAAIAEPSIAEQIADDPAEFQNDGGSDERWELHKPRGSR